MHFLFHLFILIKMASVHRRLVIREQSMRMILEYNPIAKRK